MAAPATKYGAVQVSQQPDAAPALQRDDHHGDFVTQHEQQHLSRGLHQRHISLIALAGAIVRLRCPQGTRVGGIANKLCRAPACFLALEAQSKPVALSAPCLAMPQSA